LSRAIVQTPFIFTLRLQVILAVMGFAENGKPREIGLSGLITAETAPVSDRGLA
jgi:hypothetical protein